MVDTWKMRNKGFLYPHASRRSSFLFEVVKWVFKAFKLRFLAFGLIQGKKFENFFKFFLFSTLRSFFLQFEPIWVDFGHCSIDLEVGKVEFWFSSLFWDCT